MGWFEARPILLFLIICWILTWKGLALWRAAQLRQRYWFVAILLLNTLGILDIIYLYYVTRDYKVEFGKKSINQDQI